MYLVTFNVLVIHSILLEILKMKIRITCFVSVWYRRVVYEMFIFLNGRTNVNEKASVHAYQMRREYC